MPIETLEFELLIKDNEFDKKIGDILTKAKTLNKELSKLLQAQSNNRFVTEEEVRRAEQLNNLLKEQRSLESKLNNQRKRRVDLEGKITAELQKQSQLPVPQTITYNDNSIHTLNSIRDSHKEINNEITRTSKIWSQLKNITTAYFSIMGAERLVSNMIRVSAEFEQQRVSLRAILQDINGADKLFEQIKSLAVVSPFTFKELVSYTKQLSAFSVPMGELYDTTKMLADVSAGLGVGMDRLILAYGQIRSASFLRGQEVRQLTEAGVPILQELSKMLSEIEGKYVSVGEVFDKISSRQVTFDMVAKVFKDMTSEGGKFYKMQEVLAQTLQGKLSNLADAYQIMFSEIGQKSNGVLVSSVDLLRSLAENYEKVGKTILELVSIYGIYKATLLAVAAIESVRYQATLARMAGETISKVSSLNAGLSVLIKNTRTYKSIASVIGKINPYAAIAAGVATLVIALTKCLKTTSQMDEAMSKLQKDWGVEETKLMTEFENLWGKMKAAKQGTEEYATARKTLFNRYDGEIEKLRAEGVVISDNIDSYNKLKDAIRDAAKERFNFTATESIEQEFKKSMDDVYSGTKYSLEQLSKSLNLSIGEQNVLWGYIGGYLTEDDIKKMEEYSGLFEKIATSYVSLGAGSTGPIKAAKYLDVLIEKAAIAKRSYNDATNAINKMWSSTNSSAEESIIELEGWRKSIADIIEEAEKAKVSLGLVVDRNTSLSEIVSNVSGRLKETNESYRLNLGIDEETAAIEKKRLGYLERINEILKYKATASTGDSPYKSRIDEIRQEIDAYRLLQDTYKDFLEYMSEASAKQNMIDIFAPVFGENMVNKDYESEILRLISELMNLGDEGKKAAEKILSSMATDTVKQRLEELKKQAKEFADFQERLNGYLKESMTVEEQIASLEEQRAKDLARSGLTIKEQTAINNHYNEEIDKLKESLLELTQISLTDFWQQLTGDNTSASYRYLKTLQTQAISLRNELTKIEPDKNSKNKITGYTLTQEKNADFLKSIGFDGDKLTLTISQVEQLNKVIDELYGKEAKKNSLFTLIDSISNAGGFIAFVKAMKEGNAEGKIYRDVMSEAMADVQTIGSILTDMGEALDSDFLMSLGDTFSGIGKVLDSLSKGDLLGAVRDIVSFFTSWITASSKLKKAISEVADEAERLKVASRLDEGVDTIFGDNSIQSIKNATKVLKEYAAATNADLFQYANKDIRWKSGLFKWGTSTKSLKDVVAELGYELLDEYGNLNAVALQAILDTYTDLKAADRAWIEDAIRNSEMYSEAMQQLNESLQGIYGNMLDNITDTMIDSWISAGDAALDYANILDEVARSYARLIIKQALIDSVFTEEAVQKISDMAKKGDWEGALEYTKELLETVRKDSEIYNKILEGLDEYFVKTSDEGDTLASGIKGITEDTANLLASYVNAIRADVAATRLSIDGMSVDVKAILGLLPSTPTLAEYLTKIEANTFNTSLATADILSEMRSMMTNDMGETALRVYM